MISAGNVFSSLGNLSAEDAEDAECIGSLLPHYGGWQPLRAVALIELEYWPQITPITPMFLGWTGFVVMVDQAFGLKRLVTEFGAFSSRIM